MQLDETKMHTVGLPIAYDALTRLILSSQGGETSRVSALLPLEHYDL